MVKARKVSREDLRVATASRFALADQRPVPVLILYSIEKDRGPGLGWKELKQVYTVVCRVRECSQLSSVVAGGTKEYRTAKKEVIPKIIGNVTSPSAGRVK